MHKRKDKSVAQLLIGRESACCSYLGPWNYAVSRQVLRSPSRVYKHVGMLQDRQPIYYDQNTLITKNYRNWFNVFDVESSPSFRLNFLCEREKILGCHICRSLESSDNSSVVALSDQKKLYQFCLDTGKLLRTVTLPDEYNWRSINWNKEMQSFIVKGKRRTAVKSKRNTRTMCFEFAAIVFLVHPLRLLGGFRLSPDLSLRSLTVTQDCTVMMRENGHISFHCVYCMCGSSASADRTCPDHVPDSAALHLLKSTSVSLQQLAFVDLAAPERPVSLFGICSENHHVEMGGVPWHYIMRPVSSTYSGMYVVGKLEQDYRDETKTLCLPVANQASLGMGMHTNVLFHPDESGNIVQVLEDQSINIRRTGSGLTRTDPILTIPRSTFFDDEEAPGLVTTSSGRAVRLRVPARNHSECFIEDINYDDGLDWMTFVVVDGSDEEGTASLVLVENSTGEPIKKILLSDSWASWELHSVHFEIDHIVHIRRTSFNLYICDVFNLVENFDDEDSNAGEGFVSVSVPPPPAELRTRSDNIRRELEQTRKPHRRRRAR